MFLCPEAAERGGILMENLRSSTLPLLVPRILADHVDDAAAPHDLAVLTDLLDGRTNFHVGYLSLSAAFTGGCRRGHTP